MEPRSKSDILKLLPRNRIVRHILFWIWVYLLDVIFFGLGYEDFPRFVKFALLEMPGQIFFAYTAMYWIMPRYLAKRNVAEVLVVALLAFFICGLITQFFFKAFDA